MPSSDRIRGPTCFGKALNLIFPKLSLQNICGFDHAMILSPSFHSLRKERLAQWLPFCALNTTKTRCRLWVSLLMHARLVSETSRSTSNNMYCFIYCARYFNHSLWSISVLKSWKKSRQKCYISILFILISAR